MGKMEKGVLKGGRTVESRDRPGGRLCVTEMRMQSETGSTVGVLALRNACTVWPCMCGCRFI